MTPNVAIFQLLSGAGAAFGSRVYPIGGMPPSPSIPLATFQRITGTRQPQLAGGSAAHARVTYQVNVYAASQAAADTALSLVIVAVKAHRFGSDGLRGVDVDSGPQDIQADIPGRAGELAAVSIDIGATIVDQ